MNKGISKQNVLMPQEVLSKMEQKTGKEDTANQYDEIQDSKEESFLISEIELEEIAIDGICGVY